MYSVIDSMLGLGMPQTPSVSNDRPAPDGGKQPERSDFQKLMDQARQQKPETAQKDAAGETQANGEKPVQGGGNKAEEDGQGLPTNEQMMMAALANAQLTVVSIEELETPVQTELAVETVQTMPAEQPKAGSETAAATPKTQGEAEAEQPAQPQTKETRSPLAETKQSGEAAPSMTAVRQDRQVETGTQQGGKEQDTQNLEVDAQPEAAAKPLFRDVEAAPVKVGSAPELDQSGEAEPVERQVLSQLEKAVERGDSHVRISLTPESLGSVTVEMTRAEDGALHVLLHAESPRTQSLLERSASGLQSLLMDSTQGAVQVQVERQENSQQGQQHPYDQQNGQGGQQQQDQPRQRQSQSQSDVDFMQQLRLGLIPVDGEAS